MDVLVIILINLIGAGLVTRIEKTRGKVDEDKKSLFMGQWPYNLYTMIHANDEDTCRETARQMSRKAGVKNYKLLFSQKELKKTSMKYFTAS